MKKRAFIFGFLIFSFTFNIFSLTKAAPKNIEAKEIEIHIIEEQDLGNTFYFLSKIPVRRESIYGLPKISYYDIAEKKTETQEDIEFIFNLIAFTTSLFVDQKVSVGIMNNW